MEATMIVTTANAQRWQAALDRATSNALDVLVATDGSAFVESASTPGLLYAVSRESCTCPAGTNGQPCQHRAVYLCQVGELGPQAPDGVELVCMNSDRYEVLVDGEFYGIAVATEYGGWDLFRGSFPNARRISSYCTLGEIERDLTARQPVTLHILPVAQIADLAEVA